MPTVAVKDSPPAGGVSPGCWVLKVNGVFVGIPNALDVGIAGRVFVGAAVFVESGVGGTAAAV